MSKSRATLASDITTNIPDNTSGQITPEILRTQLQDIVDAAPNLVDEPPVTSVAGRTGAVTLAKADVGLGNVDNVADASKPVSTLQAAADAAVAAAAAADATTKANAAAAASVPTSYLDADGTLAANSDSKVATQKAVKTALAAKANTSSLGTAAALDVPATGDATTAQVVKGTDTRLSDARTPASHTHPSTAISDATAVGKAVLTAADAAAARTAIGAGTATGDVVAASNNAFTGINNFTKIPSWAWVDLAGGTALTNGVPYFDAISAIRTLTFTTAAPNGTTAANWAMLRLTVTGSVVLTIPSSIRVGSSSATPITTLTLSPGVHTLVWQYENGAWYLTDTVPSPVDLASGVTGLLPAANIGIDALEGPETAVASATTTDLGAVNSPLVSITGTTTITGFGTAAAGRIRRGRFTGILTLTHNATSLILPGGANITTAAGDRLEAVSLGSGNWVVYWYARADGRAVVGSSYDCLQFGTGSFNPSASTVYYFGMGGTANTSAGRNTVYAPYAGTVTACAIAIRRTGTDSTSWTLKLRINGAAGVTLGAVSSSSADFGWVFTGLSISVPAGAILEIESAATAWSSAPTNCVIAGRLLMQL